MFKINPQTVIQKAIQYQSKKLLQGDGQPVEITESFKRDIAMEVYKELRTPNLAFKILKLIFFGVVTGGAYSMYSIIKDTHNVIYSEDDLAECDRLVGLFLDQLGQFKKPGNSADHYLFDFGNGIYFKLTDQGNGHIDINSCDQDGNSNKAYCLEMFGYSKGFSLQNLLDSVSTSKDAITIVMQPLSEENSAEEDEFTLIDSANPEVPSTPGVEKAKGGMDLEPSDWDLLDTSRTDLDQMTSYQAASKKQHTKLNSVKFNQHFSEFIQKTFSGSFRKDECGYTFNDDDPASQSPLLYVGSVLEDIGLANRFIQQADREGIPAVAPYIVKERGLFFEDHIVLLVRVNKKPWLIDPKNGFSLPGMGEKKVKRLYWQSFSDTENCGYYVFHLLTTLIEKWKTDRNADILQLIAHISAPDLKAIQHQFNQDSTISGK